MGEEVAIKETVYDQKAFIQIRLHELFLRINKLNASPFSIEPETNLYNYQIIFNDLCSIYATIYSKLRPTERAAFEDKRKLILEYIGLNVQSKVRQAGGKNMISTDLTLKNNINNNLFELRCMLEDDMNLHGFNPDKDDVGKAIIKF